MFLFTFEFIKKKKKKSAVIKKKKGGGEGRKKIQKISSFSPLTL